MAAIDYEDLLLTAQTLISEAGRNITLIQFNSTPADANKPWRGAADPRTTPDSTITKDAVFVEPSSATALGMSSEVSDLLKRSTQIAIIAPNGEDLTLFDEIIDRDGTRWKITGTEKLEPADVTLLYFIGLAR